MHTHKIYASMSRFEQLNHTACTHYKDSAMCTVIAVCVTTGKNYGQVYRAFEKLGRKHGDGCNITVWGKVLMNYGYQLKRINTEHKTVNQATKARLRNVLVQSGGRTTGHLTAFDDNGINQDWTGSRVSRKPVKSIFTITKVS